MVAITAAPSTACTTDPKTWTKGAPIQGGLMTAPQDQTVIPASPATFDVAVGALLSCSVQAATDADHWKIYYTGTTNVQSEGDTADTITYTWDDGGAGGSFDDSTASSTTWTAPTTAGAYTLTCTVDDGGTLVAPETGTRDDDPVVSSVVVTVHNTWEPGPAIGLGLDGSGAATVPNGRITAPQDQTVNPAAPAKVYAGPLQEVACSVEAATDYDTKWSGASSSLVSDALGASCYVWTGGNFVTGHDGSGNPITAASATGTSATWLAPAAAGSYTITCTINDVPTPPGTGETGTRDDPPIVRQVSVVVPTITLQIRRKGTTTYSSCASVAAGGKTTNEHEADVQVTATDGANPVSVTVRAPVISNGDGVAVSASLSPSSATTDGSGVANFTFKSSDYAAPVTLAEDSTTVTAQQRWDDMTDGSDWTYSPYFDYGVAESVTFLPAFLDGATPVSITSHTTNFLVTGLDVWEWSDTDWDYELLTGVDPSALPGLATFDPGSAGDGGGGSYNSALTVAWDDDDIVDAAYFDAQDDGVYVPGP